MNVASACLLYYRQYSIADEVSFYILVVCALTTSDYYCVLIKDHSL